MTKRTSKPVIPPHLWSPKQAGNAWETELERYHRQYTSLHLACVFRAPPSTRIVRGRMIFVAEGPPDFAGVAGSLALVLEAKTTAESRFPLKLLQEHQAVRMDEWERHDRRNIAAVLLWMREPDVRWVLPWEDLRDRWWRWNEDKAKHGEASVTVEQLDRIGMRFDRTGWLGALQAWAERGGRGSTATRSET